MLTAQDTIRVEPAHFAKRTETAILDQINAKYGNRVGRGVYKVLDTDTT